jgi:uncharacterized LabA/DUF88 family protein
VPTPLNQRTFGERNANVGAERVLHLLDVENLCATGRPTRVEAVEAVNCYVAASGFIPGHFGFASASQYLLAELAYDLPLGLRWVPGGLGSDAADRALVSAVDAGFLARRIDRLVIGSGDHAFCDLAAGFATSGGVVQVVAREHSIAAALQRVASAVVLLEPLCDESLLLSRPLVPALAPPRARAA